MPFHEGPAPTAASSSNERRVALVIGNSAYRYANELSNPVNDAETIAEVLARLGFDVTSALDLDLRTMGNVQEKFEAKLASKPDVALLFYAGHGLQVKGLNYLVPIDAEIEVPAHLNFRAVRFNDIFEPMTEWAGASLIFLDACRDNPFTRNLARSFGGDVRGAVRGGLARVQKVAGSFIAYATAPDMVAFDGKGRHSPFTSALLRHIETPNLSVSDMMIDVRNSVLEETHGRQEPWDQSSLRARFCFVPGINHPEPATPPPPFSPSAKEWAIIQNATSVAVLERFKQRYPDSYWSEYADVRIKELREADQKRRETEGEKLAVAESRPAETNEPPSEAAAPQNKGFGKNENAASTSSRDANDCLQRGIAYDHEGELDRAAAEYEKAITIDPKCAFAYGLLGSIYFRQGEVDQAIVYLDKAIAINSGHADLYVGRGEAYRTKSEFDRAIADYDKAIAIKPEYALAFRYRGLAYYEKSEFDRAIADYDNAIAVNPEDAETYFNRGVAYYNKGELDRAIADYRKALEIDSSLSAAKDNLDALESIAWGEAKESGGLQKLKLFLRDWPDSPHKTEAQMLGSTAEKRERTERWERRARIVDRAFPVYVFLGWLLAMILSVVISALAIFLIPLISIIAVIVAPVMVYRRWGRLSGIQIGLYWFGWVLASIPVWSLAFELMGWGWQAQSLGWTWETAVKGGDVYPLVSGFLMALLVGVMAGAVLAYRRLTSRRHGRTLTIDSSAAKHDV